MFHKVTIFFIVLLLIIPNSTKAEDALSDFLKDYFNVDISLWPINHSIPNDSVFSEQIGDFNLLVETRTQQIEILDDYLKIIRQNFLANMNSIFNNQRDFEDTTKKPCNLIEKRTTEQLFNDAIGYELLHLPLPPDSPNNINADNPYDEIANIAEMEKIDYLTYRWVLQFYQKYYFTSYQEQTLESADSEDFNMISYPAIFQGKDIEKQKEIMDIYWLEVPWEVISNSNLLTLDTKVNKLLEEEIKTAYEGIVLATKLDSEESLAANMIVGVCLMQLNVDNLRNKLADLREVFIKLLPCIVARQCNAS